MRPRTAAFCLALIAASLAGAAVTAASTHGVAGSQNGLLAFSSRGVIYTITADGTRRRTFGAGLDPVWSPNGRQIAFARGNDVYTSDARRYRPRLVLRAAADPAWSPSGTRLAVVRSDGIWMVAADGRGLHRLTTERPSDTSPDWSPDGRLILFDDNGSIVTANARNGSLTTVVSDPAGGSFAPVWSPRGDAVVYEATDVVSCGCPAAASWNVYSLETVRADGTHRRSLPFGTLDNGGTFDSTGAALPAWSPDGTRVAFVDYTTDSEYIAVGRLATGSWQHILRTRSAAAADASRPDWQPVR